MMAKPTRRRPISGIVIETTLLPDIWTRTHPKEGAPPVESIVEAKGRQWRVFAVSPDREDNPDCTLTLVPAEWDAANDAEVRRRIHERHGEMLRALVEILHPNGCTCRHTCERHKDDPFCAEHQIERGRTQVEQGATRTASVPSLPRPAQTKTYIMVSITVPNESLVLIRVHARDKKDKASVVTVRVEKSRRTSAIRYAAREALDRSDLITLTVMGAAEDDVHTVAYLLTEAGDLVCIADGAADEVVRRHLSYQLRGVPSLDDLVSLGAEVSGRKVRPRYRHTGKLLPW